MDVLPGLLALSRWLDEKGQAVKGGVRDLPGILAGAAQDAKPGPWLDQIKRNVAFGVQNPDVLWAQMNEDARKYRKDSLNNWGEMKSVMPEVRGPAEREFVSGGMELAGLAPAGMLGWTAFHGSPHKFDKFSLDKIGTGEGAQAYGHGLYFAESPAVAKDYADKLAGGIFVEPSVPVPIQNEVREALTVAGKKNNPANPIEYLKAKQANVRNDLEMGNYEKSGGVERALIDRYEEAIKALEDRKYEIKQSNMYRVDISDAKAPQDAFLQWDKPLSEQTPKVKGMLAKIGVKETQPDLLEEAKAQVLDAAKRNDSAAFGQAQKDWTLLAYPPTGAEIYRQFATDKRASEVLRQAGIPGIRYADAGSRNKTTWMVKHPQGGINEFPDEAGARAWLKKNPKSTLIPPEQTMNTVLFDDSLVKILERNGVPISGLLAP